MKVKCFMNCVACVILLGVMVFGLLLQVSSQDSYYDSKCPNINIASEEDIIKQASCFIAVEKELRPLDDIWRNLEPKGAYLVSKNYGDVWNGSWECNNSNCIWRWNVNKTTPFQYYIVPFMKKDEEIITVVCRVEVTGHFGMFALNVKDHSIGEHYYIAEYPISKEKAANLTIKNLPEMLKNKNVNLSISDIIIRNATLICDTPTLCPNSYSPYWKVDALIKNKPFSIFVTNYEKVFLDVPSIPEWITLSSSLQEESGAVMPFIFPVPLEEFERIHKSELEEELMKRKSEEKIKNATDKEVKNMTEIDEIMRAAENYFEEQKNGLYGSFINNSVLGNATIAYLVRNESFRVPYYLVSFVKDGRISFVIAIDPKNKTLIGYVLNENKPDLTYYPTPPKSEVTKIVYENINEILKAKNITAKDINLTEPVLVCENTVCKDFFLPAWEVNISTSNSSFSVLVTQEGELYLDGLLENQHEELWNSTSLNDAGKAHQNQNESTTKSAVNKENRTDLQNYIGIISIILGACIIVVVFITFRKIRKNAA